MMHTFSDGSYCRQAIRAMRPAQAGECLLTGYLWPGASLWHQAYNLSRSDLNCCFYVIARSLRATKQSQFRTCRWQAVILQNFLVVIVLRKHLIPFRTQQLSSKTPMVLRGQPRGRVGRRQVYESLVTLLRGSHPFQMGLIAVRQLEPCDPAQAG
jgi:hypothetical protein